MGVHLTSQAVSRYLFNAEVMVDALGIVPRVTRPEQDVEVRLVPDIEPVEDMVKDLLPSLL
jgi:hypothetical protein